MLKSQDTNHRNVEEDKLEDSLIDVLDAAAYNKMENLANLYNLKCYYQLNSKLSSFLLE